MRQIVSLPHYSSPHYSAAIKASGEFLFLSGQVGLHADGSWADGFAAQTELAIENMRRTLADGGASLANIVKMAVFLADVKDGPEFNHIYERHFKTDLPCRSRFQVGLLAPECLIEIDVIAVL